MQTGDSFHLEMAEILRQYVRALKTWIHSEEDLSRLRGDHSDMLRHSEDYDP